MKNTRFLLLLGFLLSTSSPRDVSAAGLGYQSTTAYYSEFFAEIRKVRDARPVSLLFTVEGSDIAGGPAALECEASARVGVLTYSKGARIALQARVLDLDGNTLENLGKKTAKVKKDEPGRSSFPLTALSPGQSFVVQVTGRWRKKKDTDRVETICVVKDGQAPTATALDTRSAVTKASSPTTTIGVELVSTFDPATRRPPSAMTGFRADFHRFDPADGIFLQPRIFAKNGSKPAAGVIAQGGGFFFNFADGPGAPQSPLSFDLETPDSGTVGELVDLSDEIPQLGDSWFDVGWLFERGGRTTEVTIRVTATLVEVPN